MSTDRPARTSSVASSGDSRSHRGLGRRLVLAGGAAVAMFLVGEVLCRLAVPPPVLYRQPQVFYDRREGPLGWEMRPHQSSFTHAAPVRTNALGFRDREVEVPKPAGAVRVLALGDSLTFGAGVESGSTWPKQLERMLRGSLHDPSIEVVNAGVEAYWTRQEVELLKQRGLALGPDLVVFGVYWNDLPQRGFPDDPPLDDRDEPTRDRSPGTNAADTGADPGKEEHWGLVDREGHILGRPALPLGLRNLLKRSRFLFAAKQAFDRFRFSLSPRREFLWQDAVLQGHSTPRMEQSWLRVRDALREAVSLGEEHGFRLLVVAFPMPDQVLRSRPAALYPKRVLEICDELSIASLDLLSAFRSGTEDPTNLFIRWDGHPTGFAHGLAAEAIADTLLERSLLPTR